MKQAVFAVALVSMMSQVASAQNVDKSQLALQAANARQASQQAMQSYSWKSRSELTVEDEVQAVKLETVRYDLDGKQQRTLMNERVLEPKPKRGLRGKLQEKKAEKAHDWMVELNELLQSYVVVTKGQLVDFFDKASVKPEGAAVRIEGVNFLHAGDRMTYWVDQAHKTPVKMEVQTALQGDPVKLVIEFRATTDGLTYPARSTATVPAKEVQIKIENFEYSKSS